MSSKEITLSVVIEPRKIGFKPLGKINQANSILSNSIDVLNKQADLFSAQTQSLTDLFGEWDIKLGRNSLEQATKEAKLDAQNFKQIERAKQRLAKLFLEFIKDGNLSDGEKKEILQRIKDLKSLKSHLDYKKNNDDNLFIVPKIETKEIYQSMLEPRLEEKFKQAYKDIELQIKEQINLDAADGKISTEEQLGKLDAEAELDEIKELGAMVLEAILD